MFESCKALSLNSHETVLEITAPQGSPAEALRQLQKVLAEKQIPFPQLLFCESQGSKTQILLTGPEEIMTAVKRELPQGAHFSVNPKSFSTVTLTCTGSTSPEISQQVLDKMETLKIPIQKLILSAMSTTVVIESQNRKSSIESLHSLIQA